MSEQFYLVLPSNSSMKFFPDNRTTCFTTELPEQMNLYGRWEVGLSEILFPKSFLHVRKDECTIRYQYHDEKGVHHLHEVDIPSGVYESISEFVETLNHHLAELKPPHIGFEFESKNGGKVSICRLCDNCESVHLISLHEKIERILGFSPDQKINNYDSMKFPDFGVGRYLPLDSRHRGLVAEHPAQLANGLPNRMFVYCDLCEPRIVGDVKTPLLRMVKIDTRRYIYGSDQVEAFPSPHYIPMLHTRFRTILIDIRDHLGDSIPFETGTLTVTLHFRRLE